MTVRQKSVNPSKSTEHTDGLCLCMCESGALNYFHYGKALSCLDSLDIFYSKYFCQYLGNQRKVILVYECARTVVPFFKTCLLKKVHMTSPSTITSCDLPFWLNAKYFFYVALITDTTNSFHTIFPPTHINPV